MRAAPPRLVRFLLAWATDPRQRRWLLADLEEEFADIRRDRGARAARRWYRSQALRSILHGVRRRAQRQAAAVTTHRGGAGMDAWIHDLRGGARSLRRAPAFTAVAAAILALGIAANTTVFSLVSPFLFRPLPYDEADRLVHLFETDPRLGWLAGANIRQSLPTFEDWSRQTDTLDAMGAYTYSGVNLAGAGAEPERIDVARLSAGLPDLLGVETVRGRWFGNADAGPDAGPVVVLGHGLWQRRFGGASDAVGATLRVDGVAHRVVGVAPPSFHFPFGGIQMWTPLRLTPGARPRDDRFLLVVGRLAEGRTLDEARAELAGIHRTLVEEYPDAYEETGVRVVPIREALIFFYDLLRGLLLLLLTTVGFVLLIVCANVASLTLSRALGRRRELAVRSALGAGRWRLVRQLLTESVVLAGGAGALGALLAVWVVGLAGPAIPPDIFRVGEIEVDTAALGYTLLVSLAVAVAVGGMPALRLTRSDLAGPLRDGSGATGPRRGRLTRLLVVAQVATALVLGVAAASTVAATRALGGLELGFRPAGVLTTSVSPPATDYAGRQELAVFTDQVLSGVRGLAGVESAALADLLPMDFAEGSVRYSLPGQGGDAGGSLPQATRFRVTPGYFAALGIPLLEGRSFEGADVAGTPPVVVVNRMLARQLWPGGGAVGRRLDLHGDDGAEPATVVGVVGDSIGGIVFLGMQPQVFVPWAQAPTRRTHLVVRATGDPRSLVGPVRQEIHAVAPDLPLGAFRTMEDLVGQAVAPLRMTSWLIGAFGLFAVTLAALGIYGVVAHSVGRRTREIGLRMALGARPANVRRLLLRQGGGLVAAGLALGLVLSVAVTLLLSGVAAQAGPQAPESGGWWLIPSVALVLTGVAVAAGWLPARRATRIDPVVALRRE